MPTKKKPAPRKKRTKTATKQKSPGQWVWVFDPPKVTTNAMFDVTVSLVDVEPKIWRRFLLARTATFAELHQAIQDACGWENYHAWAFRDAKGRDDIAGVFEDVPDGRRVKLAAHVGAKGARFVYEYDFGDGWLHRVDVTSTDETGGVRRLVDGARSFPPEDCGGLGGYERYAEFIETGVDPWSEDAADVKRWLGRWTPDGFKYATVAKKFDA